MDQPLCGTALTGAKLQDLLLFSDSSTQKLQVNGHRISGVEAKIIGEGSGFTSKVLRVILQWEGGEGGDSAAKKFHHMPRSCIVKVIGSSAMRDAMPELEQHMTGSMDDCFHRAHAIECKIYDLVENGLSSVVPMVRCYAKSISSVGPEQPAADLIVLEDLSERMRTTAFIDMGLPIPPGQLDQLLQVLSSLHAWSVNKPDHWKSAVPTLAQGHVIPNFYHAMSTTFPASKAKFPDRFAKLDEAKVKQYCSQDSIIELFGSDPKPRYNLPTVLVHGDIHLMNMIFEKPKNNKDDDDEGNGGKLLALIDWQLAHHGCAMEDIARAIFMCVPYETAEGRADIVAKYVQMYNGKVENVENHVTLEDCEKATDEMYAFLSLVFCCNVGMMDSLPKEMFKGQASDEQIEAFKKRAMEQTWKHVECATKFYGC